MRIITAALLLAGAASAQQPARDLARQCLKELVEINTTDSVGDNTRAAEAVARRLKAAGFPDSDVEVMAPAPQKGNVVARLRGSGHGKPVLFIGHIDVVEARREDWSFDPFTLIEKDGFFYGRGTLDMKGDASLMVANFVRLEQEGYRPSRDVILALTADEEGGRGPNGIAWLLANRRELIDAEFAINADAGGGLVKNGARQYYAVQAAEKGYASFKLRATNAGGHSSLPVPQNAIYQLSEALVRVRDLKFPVRLNAVTKSYFERMGTIEKGQTAADMTAIASGTADAAAEERLSAVPFYNALLRTTCVATMLSGGHADNALPQSAEATVNCRLAPDEPLENVRQALSRAVAGLPIELTPPSRYPPNPASPIPPDLMTTVERVARASWPGIPVIPVMETGGTDGKALRGAGMPTYGASAIFVDMDDIRAHGRDERISVQYFYDGLDYNYRLIRALGN